MRVKKNSNNEQSSAPKNNSILEEILTSVREIIHSPVDSGSQTNEKFSKREQNVEFVSKFYEKLLEDDLATIPSVDLAYGALSMYDFIATRKLDEGKLKIFNPSDDHLKWGAHHTIVEYVGNDLPFLLGSISACIENFNLNIILISRLVSNVARDKNGNLNTLSSTTSDNTEIAIQIRIAKIDDPQIIEELENEIKLAIRDTSEVAEDRNALKNKVIDAIGQLEENAPSEISLESVSESTAFLNWLLRGNFIIMGARTLLLKTKAKETTLTSSGKSLGILKNPENQVLRRGDKLVDVTPEILEFLKLPNPLIISKANVRSRVHRRVHLDYIGVKLFDDIGTLTGELRLVGLFTSSVYFASVQRIPLLRKKVEAITNHPDVPEGAHTKRSLINILETYPRDDMFQIDTEQLAKISVEIISLKERPRTRLFVRKDKFERYISSLVFISKRHFNTDLVEKIGELLAKSFNGHVSLATPYITDGPLAMLHIIIGHRDGKLPQVDECSLENQIDRYCESWGDLFAECIIENWPDDNGRILANRYANSFSAAYENTFQPEEAVSDLAYLEEVDENNTIAVRVQGKQINSDNQEVNIKLYSLHNPIPMAERIPILDNLGIYAVSERTYEISKKISGNIVSVWLHDINIGVEQNEIPTLLNSSDALENAFSSIWLGRNQNDGYNLLILSAGLVWQQVLIFRAIGHYLHQVGFHFTESYICNVLVENANVTTLLMNLFQTKFDTNFAGSEIERKTEISKINEEINSSLDAIASLDHDKVLRTFRDVIDNIVRTNVYQLTSEDIDDGKAIAIKVASGNLPFVPQPRPFREIFVMSPTVEGIHLREGPVARGGIRWSDRPQDFRTEVLGLVKSQQVKNAVIVPVGAKGGFVPKFLPPAKDRDAFLAAGISAYKKFISALLDITDNVKNGKVIHPQALVRHEDDDPYLVVAADKGTATFSDIANSIAQDHQFWLDDAFASGGSAGYDHKAMGITARGAWEAVKRHFREMNYDIQSKNFTAVGVGDMSGDVFGNGMLLSSHTKLVGAFNHLHIFVDPDPDPKVSFEERQRLFALPRSNWIDYDASLISSGGGIYSRADKSIELSDEVKKLTGITADSVTPNELIKALLRSQIDLLWFGGIGTYIRSSSETDEQVGDRNTDAVRVEAREVRAKVVGEGANLGVTQLARIEYSKLGGKINTDFIDNAAGVNTSDVEVNIKIALAALEQAGKLERSNRNVLLADMTSNVADLVLQSNYDVTLALTLIEREAISQRDDITMVVHNLEKLGLLNRSVEFLPDDIELTRREKENETYIRPELAIILSYAKNVLQAKILETTIIDNPYLEQRLISYFPQEMLSLADNEIRNHKLRREIIATKLVNQAVNWCGPVFLWKLNASTGNKLEECFASFIAAYDGFAIGELIAAVDDLDNIVSSEIQLELYGTIQRFLRRIVLWYCSENLLGSNKFNKTLTELPGHVSSLLEWFTNEGKKTTDNSTTSNIVRMVDQGVGKELAASIALLDSLTLIPDIISIANSNKKTIFEVAEVHASLAYRLRVAWLTQHINPGQATDHYEQLALGRASISLHRTLGNITRKIVSPAGATNIAFMNWMKNNENDIRIIENIIDEAIGLGELSFARLTVIISRMQDLIDKS